MERVKDREVWDVNGVERVKDREVWCVNDVERVKEKGRGCDWHCSQPFTSFLADFVPLQSIECAAFRTRSRHWSISILDSAISILTVC